MNCNGTMVSVTLRPLNKPETIDPKLYIYDIEKNILKYFNFASGRNDNDDISVPPNSAQSHLRSNDFLGTKKNFDFTNFFIFLNIYVVCISISQIFLRLVY